MEKNNLYNILTQLTQEQKSHWRISKDYASDAKNTPELKAFWKKLAKEKEAHIKELQELIKKYLK